MRLISLINGIRCGWLAALATAAVVSLASPADAQTVPPPPAGALSSADLAKVHLTAARNALSDVTQLPAAAQLTGESRTRVQQLITSFNALIGKSDWRGPYAQVEANLSTLLGSETPATATPGAVGTSGAASGLDPAIRAKLVEFRAHLDMFKTVASTAAPATAAPPAAAAPPSPTPPPTPAPATTPPATPPATMPPAPTAPPAPPPTEAPPASPDPRPDAPSPADAVIDDAQDVSGVARDLLLHVEALEVILGAQARVQAEATVAAGGVVVSSETPSGSTRTTVTGPDVTLNGEQLEQVKAHLAEMRRLLEKK